MAEPSAAGTAGRRRARQEALFILYQQDLLGLDGVTALDRSQRGGAEPKPYTRRLVLGVADYRADLDRTISEHLENWTLERLGPVERNILRIAVFEAGHVEDVSTPVAINEAVELAKRFGSYEAAGLINGVLGSLAAS